MLTANYQIYLSLCLKHFSISVCNPEALSFVRQEDSGGRDVSGELLQPEGGETQQARDRNQGVPGAPPKSSHRLQERKGASPDRA